MYTQKQLNHLSVSIGRQSKGVDKIIHTHCVRIAEFINGNGNGNVTPATFFIAQLGEGTRKNAIKQWFIDLAGCVWDTESRVLKRAKHFTYDPVAAQNNPWYKWTSEAPFIPVDGRKLLENALKRMKKALEDTEHAGQHKIDKALVTGLERLLDPEKDRRADKKEDDKTEDGVIDAEYEVIHPDKTEDKAEDDGVVMITHAKKGKRDKKVA